MINSKNLKGEDVRKLLRSVGIKFGALLPYAWAEINENGVLVIVCHENYFTDTHYIHPENSPTKSNYSSNKIFNYFRRGGIECILVEASFLEDGNGEITAKRDHFTGRIFRAKGRQHCFCKKTHGMKLALFN
ncbi:MAG: hypothetical protein NT086_17485 [Proteobacteria bacterium]|nr:hypothetical protein [Pseudomonadota bacterium]